MRRATRVLSCIAVLSAQRALAANPIAAGDLVVFRSGDGSAPLTGNTTASFLDEFSLTGTLVQSIPLPTSGALACTVDGSISTEGVLSLSQNQQLITFAGYRIDAGGSSAVTGNRVVGTLDPNGTVNVATNVTDVTGNIRSAATVDGSQLYFVYAQGVRLVNTAYSNSSTTTQIDSRNSRQVLMSGNKLVATNGVGSTPNRVQTYGNGVAPPTVATSPTPIVTQATTDIVHGETLVDLDPSVPGDDTMYICQTNTSLIQKYVFNGTTWSLKGSISLSSTPLNIFARPGTGGSVNLYFIDTPSLATPFNSLYAFTDSSGFGGTLSGTIDASNRIATAPTNTGFRGVAGFISIPVVSILGDANHDGSVNTADFGILAAHFNETTAANWPAGDITADFNHDGVINAIDFNAIATNFGATPAPVVGLRALVPEPGCATLTGCLSAAIAMAARRRRHRGSSI